MCAWQQLVATLREEVAHLKQDRDGWRCKAKRDGIPVSAEHAVLLIVA
jgi:hypothetical protein